MTQSVREDIAKEEYEKDDWEVFSKGAPDLLLIKRDDKEKIKDVKFREIKGRRGINGRLSKEQKEWIEALKFSGIDADVKHVSKMEIKGHLNKNSLDIDKVIEKFNLSEKDLYKIDQLAKETKRARTSGFLIAAVIWILYKSEREVPNELPKFVDIKEGTLRNSFNSIAKEKNSNIRISISRNNCETEQLQISIMKNKGYYSNCYLEDRKRNKEENEMKSLLERVKSKINFLSSKN